MHRGADRGRAGAVGHGALGVGEGKDAEDEHRRHPGLQPNGVEAVTVGCNRGP